jgi:predicted DNA-binding protein (MmcQ/YjbR family)
MAHAPPVRHHKELWTCPRCGRRFVSRNIWHACGDYSVEGFLEGKGSRARQLFDRFEELIAACGPYEVAPAKTRVAFMGRVRFAGVQSVSDRGMTIAFALTSPLRHPRIRKVERIVPGWYGHWMRVTSPEELDDQVLGWLRESYHQMGMQERLAGKD